MMQLDLLRQVDALLRPVDIKFWLRGGWAIDFLLGRLTRSHSDIDIVAWEETASQLRHCFEEAGFLFTRDTGVQFYFSKSGFSTGHLSLYRLCKQVKGNNKL